ncbi:MAG TPA: type I-MYXAN CRISPR-associated protein Cmx8 [Kofleriaceae bacterium]|nr:type I-MYXAN CRISPR-associated protein Cmx8 [Kofleriaceae bacterium]
MNDFASRPGAEKNAPRKAKAAPKPKPKAAAEPKAAEEPSSPVSLRWDLAELPSAQHKAGLAGLALCVEFLGRSRDRKGKGTCEIEALDASGLTLRVDRQGMQALFDEVYAASMEEQERDKKFQKKTASGAKVDIEPKKTLEKVVTDKKGVEKTKTVYVYDQVIPQGALVAEWAGDQHLWLKLWRDLIWGTLRGVPATREAYNCRAEKREATDGAEAWDELVSTPLVGVELPSTYYLGAQARSAENVSFRDVARYRFLLHFWPFVVPIYVPAVVGRDGDREFVGHAIAVPDVANLQDFVAHWEQVARERSGDASGYVPRDAVVEIAAEAGLDVARRTFTVVSRLQGAAATRRWVTAIEVFHVEKEGNNVRLRGVRRIDLQRKRADVYGRVRNAYWSPLFRRRRIISILDGNERDPVAAGGLPWWTGFGRLCATSPEELTIKDSKFRHDCRIAFTEVEMTESTGESEKTLEQLIYQVVRTYVLGKLASKHGHKWDEVKGTAKEKDYNEKKEKVAREAFLAVRSRTGMAFVSYFTGTICSVSQWLNEKSYLEIAQALHDEREVERARSLTLLALSAVA